MPAVVLFVGFVLVPSISSIYYSLTSWDGISRNMDFIGLRNYVDIFKSDRFWNSFRNTLFFTVALTIIENVVALSLALLVNKLRRTQTLFRSIFYLPNLLSGIVTGYIWVALMNYTFGVINQVFNSIGLPSVDWLGNPDLALWSVIFVMVWKSSGYYMIIYIAGLSGIPKELIEASQIDGASGWRQFVSITMPLLASTFTINLTLSLIGGLRIFDQIVAMTSGGPGFATETITYQIFSVAFSEGKQGYGTALAILLFLITMVFTGLQSWVTRHFEVEA
jgi:ABC-type sugar transport system permease subunit